MIFLLLPCLVGETIARWRLISDRVSTMYSESDIYWLRRSSTIDVLFFVFQVGLVGDERCGETGV